MGTEVLEQAIASTRGVLANVTTEQLDLATPCSEWAVRDVINHVVGGQFFFAAAVDGTPPAEDAPDYASGDFLAAFDDGARRSLAAFGADGAMDKTLDLPFGQMPTTAFLNIATGDTFTHGWDLAKATGQSTDLDPELATQLYAPLTAMLKPEFRDRGAFGPEQPAPDGAGPADRLAAFMGRTV